jgi:hypothetical protein
MGNVTYEILSLGTLATLPKIALKRTLDERIHNRPGKIKDSLRTKHFDAARNHGPKQVSILVQFFKIDKRLPRSRRENELHLC